MRPTNLLARLSVPLYRASLQVAASPCWTMVVPDVISACLSLDAWTFTPAVWWVPLPITSPPPSAFPQSSWVGSPRQSVQRLPNGRWCRSCSHSLMFRPRGLLPPRSLLPPCR